MSVAIKNLGVAALINGAPSFTPGPGPGKSWIVKSIILTNKNSASRTMDISLIGGAASPSGVGPPVSLVPPSFPIPGLSTVILDSEVTLQFPTGGVAQVLGISASGTGTIAVDVVINGLERDV